MISNGPAWETCPASIGNPTESQLSKTMGGTVLQSNRIGMREDGKPDFWLTDCPVNPEFSVVRRNTLRAARAGAKRSRMPPRISNAAGQSRDM